MPNDQKNWGAEPEREPKIADGDEAVRSEHGRITHDIDYRSHWFVLARANRDHSYLPHSDNQLRRCDSYTLYVKHGGGEERIPMPTVNFRITANVIASAHSDVAYLLMHHLFDIHQEARRDGARETAAKYKAAFVDGRLKKRKLPAQGTTKVWIEPKAAEQDGVLNG